MYLILLQFFFSALVIISAGTFLAKFADKIAEITGWGKMFVGGLLLAIGTSMPELMVDINAVKIGLPNLAAGDLLGSSLFNLLILAILDFSFPSIFKRTAFSPQNIHHSLTAVLCIFLTSIVGVAISSKLETTIFNISIFSWSLLIVYIFGLRLIFLEKKQETLQSENESLSLADQSRQRTTLLLSFAGYVASAVVILFTSPYLVDSADKMSKLTGLGHTFIGTTLVAIATSLPELASTLAAFRMGSPDLALGNIFGSNAFNMLLFLPLDFYHPHSIFTSIQSIHSVTAFCIIGAMSVAIMGQLYRKKERSKFTEPSSEIVVGLILLFLYLLYHLNA